MLKGFGGAEGAEDVEERFCGVQRGIKCFCGVWQGDLEPLRRLGWLWGAGVLGAAFGGLGLWGEGMGRHGGKLVWQAAAGRRALVALTGWEARAWLDLVCVGVGGSWIPLRRPR